jgi:hypothetical protein
MMPRSRRWHAPLTVLLASLLAACASIPDSSDLIPLGRVDQSDIRVPIPVPPANVDALTLVHSFVEAAAEPENNFAAARLHLTPAAQESWKPPQTMLIVQDNVDTIPVPSPPDTPAGVQWVSLQATKAGWLMPDQSFVPDSGQYVVQLQVERQPDGQWRIATPPRDLVVGQSSFSANYKQVPVYFLDHRRTGVVPDLRYVVSQPASTLPRRVVDLLVMGPSKSFRSAMGTALPAGVHPQTNVSEADDGALVVNFSSLSMATLETRRLIAAQVVLSLKSVSNARVRLQEDGAPLLSGQEELRPGDVASYDTGAVRQNLPGLVVVDERLRTLDQRAAPVPGPTGSGELAVLLAGRSPNGTRLAAVVRRPAGGVELEVGPYGAAPVPLGVQGSFMSKPTWLGEGEFWTVVDGQNVLRISLGPDGRWTPTPVDTRAFVAGHEIVDLRLSRDGTRAAGVVDGQIVVAGIGDQNGQAVLGQPAVLPGGLKTATVTGVEWLNDTTLVAITNSSALPVIGVTVDGFKRTNYASENLTQPMSAITISPDQKIVVADHSGIWQASGAEDVWHLLPVPIGGSSIPFFPG